jgi:hypothetical protein
MKDNSRTKGIAPLTLKLGGKLRWVVNFKPRSLYPTDYLDILEKRKKFLLHLASKSGPSSP